MVEFKLFKTKKEMGKAAAIKVAEFFEGLQAKKETVRFVAATGTSQFEFLDALCSMEGIDWQKTEMFHLDEYVGLPDAHPASFRHYLKKRLVNKVYPGMVHFINGDADDIEAECRRIDDLISEAPVDIAFVGIGENGHLAFNDPPANFKTEKPYIVVNLDEKCRRQQVGEGWFDSIEEVPKQAISMSIQQIMKSKHIICICPDERKAKAVRDCLSEDSPVSQLFPASILKTHGNACFYLDEDSASLLQNRTS